MAQVINKSDNLDWNLIISAVSEEVSASAQEIAAASEELSASSNEVEQTAKLLQNTTGGMITEVDRFKI